MLKNLWKVLAALAGVTLAGYFLARNIWELNAVKQLPGENEASPKHKKSVDAELAGIRDQAHRINYERIGKASPDQADDLKQIKGVGPTIEKKLNALGIYTFGQIAGFGKEDEHTVGEIIAFFPGRIERDEWVKQAENLKQQKDI